MTAPVAAIRAGLRAARTSSWRQWYRIHLGWPGLAALALLAACVACWVAWMPELARERSRLDGRQQVTASSTRGTTDALTQRALETLAPEDLPALRQRGADLEALVGAAQRHGLVLQRADYSAGAAVGGRLVRVEANLPLSGSYAQLRSFIAAVLNDLPHAALDSLHMERPNSQSAQLQVQARWVLFYREDAR
jgi:hypothetical protein